MTTEELKEIYNKSPNEWIVVAFEQWNKWVEFKNPYFTDSEIKYQLIHIKHKDILEAYLADNNVWIQHSSAYIVDNFIEEYNPDLEYRLKNKEYYCTCDSSGVNNTTNECITCGRQYKSDWEKEDGIESIGDSSNSDTDSYKINNFEEYGFTADFEHEFYKLSKDGKWIIGSFADPLVFDYIIGAIWDRNNGKCFIADNYYPNYNLTPIKREWYEYEENFPALIRIDDRFEVANSINNLLDVSGNIVSTLTTLATRDEVMSLLVEEDDD